MSNDKCKAAVSTFQRAKEALMDFESENQAFVEAFHRVIDGYNNALNELDVVLRRETAFEADSKVVRFDGGIQVQKAITLRADPAKIHRKAPGLFAQHPEVITEVDARVLAAHHPGLFEELPEAVVGVDVKTILKLHEMGLLPSAALEEGVWNEEQVRVTKPKAISLKVS